MEISRRDFLKSVGGITGGLFLFPSVLGGDLKGFAREAYKTKPIVWERVIESRGSNSRVGVPCPAGLGGSP